MMPSFALVRVASPSWLPPLPIPLFLGWPLVWMGFLLARLMIPFSPIRAAQVHLAMQVFSELRGLSIDVDASDSHIHVRFV